MVAVNGFRPSDEYGHVGELRLREAPEDRGLVFSRVDERIAEERYCERERQEALIDEPPTRRPVGVPRA